MKLSKKLNKEFAIIIALALVMSNFSFSIAFANENTKYLSKMVWSQNIL